MLEKFQIHMTSFYQDRMIRVYLPQDYNEKTKRYPVLYMHDGQNVFDDEDAFGGISLGLKDYLDKQRLDVIVVGIDRHALNEERVNEYCPWTNGVYSKKLIGQVDPLGGKGKTYLDFIVNELKPLIDGKYRTISDQTSMAGISLGGLISTFAACCYPHIFTRVFIMSSAFYRNQEEIENLLRNSDLSSIEKFYLDCGTNEAGDDEMISKEFLASNKNIYHILEPKITHTQFEILEEAEHKYVHFKKRAPEIFSFLYHDLL
ncbi:putative alpha/beta superfamily hydrolase [Paenibacillus sp. V4I3]|uniref:alpha/beta hydrolase n=1 Tax=Paenibacillus sp. V4I3 TaxID=3042305 RepID=UPI0027829E6B|nr:alpha/beta hydrolase-fold protein [Paenibacillus sp. V4I3]MDQ0876018.1 putative alpha/beta superfamily hydrolase [Paenibacillus sp. V4I3]